jgi:signal transduction histidine kinase
MNQTSASSIPLGIMSDLNCATDQATLLHSLQTALQVLAGEVALQAMWYVDGVPQPLLPKQTTTFQLTPAEQDRLAAGQIVQQGDIVYIPMIVLGTLQGWVILRTSHVSDATATVIIHAGTVLYLLQQQTKRTSLDGEQTPDGISGEHRGKSESDAVTRKDNQTIESINTQTLTRLLSTANLLHSSQDLQSLSREIINAIQVITGSPRITLNIVDPDRQRIRLIAQTGLDLSITTQQPSEAIEVALATLEQSRKIGTAIYHLGSHWLTHPFKDCVLVTMFDLHDKLIGMIAFDLQGSNAPLSEAQIQGLEIVASQAAIMLQNTQLSVEQQKTVDRLTALNAFSLAATTAQLSTDELLRMTVNGAVGTTNAIGGGTSLLEYDGSQRCQVIGLSFNCGDAINSLFDEPTSEDIQLDEAQLPQIVRDVGIKSVIAVAIRGAKLLLGRLWIAYNTPKIATTDREMVVLYAKMVGAVLENSYLFNQTSTAYAQLASILASTAEGILLATAQGHIVVANNALGQLLELDNNLLLGHSLDELCEHVAATNQQMVMVYNALQQVASGEQTKIEGEIEWQASTQRYLAWSALPVRGDADPGMALLVLRDITKERQTEKLRQDLTHMIVHDLRAPLTNIMVSTDLLLKQTGGTLNPTQQRIAQITANSSRQMLDLVNALLDVRRLEQQRLELQQQPVELFDLVASVLERFERVVGKRRLTIENATDQLPPIMADIVLIQRVLQNLLDNAIKFSPTNSTICIWGTVATNDMLPAEHPAGPWTLIEVSDQGPGIPKEYWATIFELFSQAPLGRGQGSGIGLAFCKLAVSAHGGMIWVADNPGGGAAVRFTLPLAA